MNDNLHVLTDNELALCLDMTMELDPKFYEVTPGAGLHPYPDSIFLSCN